MSSFDLADGARFGRLGNPSRENRLLIPFVGLGRFSLHSI